MKRYVAILLFLVFLFPVCLIRAQEVKKPVVKTETPQKRDLKHKTKKIATTVSSEVQVNEQRKKEVEAKEQSTDKKTKVMMFDTDKDLPQAIKKRNIP